MKKDYKATLVAVIVTINLMFLCSTGWSMDQTMFGEREFVPGEVLVKFKPVLSHQAIKETIAYYGASELIAIPKINVYKLGIPSCYTVEEMVKRLQVDSDIEYAHPNYIYHLCEIPNDPYFGLQWGLHNTGQTGGISNSDIDAPEAWERENGDASIIIAILDTGVDLNHPDLKNKLVAGYDFINNDVSPQDDRGHGTHVAGIAAAEANNGIGIAGVSWKSKIMPVKIGDANGSFPLDAIIAGLVYATDNGARIINMSFGGWWYEDTPAERDAIQYAYRNGVVLVAAAGNENWPIPFSWYGWDYRVYPAAYWECLSVAATDNTDGRASFSNYGDVDVAAPGVDVLSLRAEGTDMYGDGTHVVGDKYYLASGTSMAAPFVAGMAALILSDKPWLTVEEVMYKIRYSAKTTGGQVGYGRINAANAVVPINIP